MRELRKEEIARLHMIASKKSKMKLQVAIYARKSREDKTDMSLSTQIDECKEFILKYDSLLDINNIEIFSEDNASGFFMEEREEQKRLLEAIENETIDVVIVSKSDRFSRDSVVMASSIRTIEKHNGYLVVLDDMGDDSAAGVLIRQIMWATNEFQVRRSAEDVMKVHSRLVENGYTVGGPGNYGYDVKNRKYVINPEEAIGVDLVFSMFLEGKSYADISDELENRGIKPRKSNRFSFATIHSILTNERNCGISTWNSHEKRKDRKRVVKELFPEVTSEEVVPEAIISKERFELVQDLLQNRASGKKVQNKSPYLLTGILECGSCHEAITGNSQTSGRSKTVYRTYFCKNHQKKHGGSCSTKPIRVEYLEDMVKEQITFIINKTIQQKGFDSDLLESYLEQERAMLTRLKREETEYQNLLSKMTIGLYQASSVTVKKATEQEIERLDRILTQTSIRIVEIQKKIDTIIASITTVTSKNLTKEQIFVNDELSKRIIRTFISKIKVTNQDISIEFN